MVSKKFFQTTIIKTSFILNDFGHLNVKKSISVMNIGDSRFVLWKSLNIDQRISLSRRLVIMNNIVIGWHIYKHHYCRVVESKNIIDMKTLYSFLIPIDSKTVLKWVFFKAWLVQAQSYQWNSNSRVSEFFERIPFAGKANAYCQMFTIVGSWYTTNICGHERVQS